MLGERRLAVVDVFRDILVTAPNAPEAEPFIRRDYRKGWSLT